MSIERRAVEKKKRTKTTSSRSGGVRRKKAVATPVISVTHAVVEFPVEPPANEVAPMDSLAVIEEITATPSAPPAFAQESVPSFAPESALESVPTPGPAVVEATQLTASLATPDIAAETPGPLDVDVSLATPGGLGAIRNVWERFASFLRTHSRPKKRLRVCESVSLGEKRFLAIVSVDSESFLLGGSTGNVAMLAKLTNPETFSSTLARESGAFGLSQ
jgi:Flagellar biosynthesis protein, FliO